LGALADILRKPRLQRIHEADWTNVLVLDPSHPWEGDGAGMKPAFSDDKRTIERRVARRRFCALTSLAALAVLLVCTSVVSGAGSLATTALREAHILPGDSGPALADNHVAHQRRPASVAGRYSVSDVPGAPFPAGPTDGQQPVSPAPAAVSPAVPSSPTATPPAESEPPESSEPTPPPKNEPEPPPKSEPEPPPKSEPEPPPKSEPEPPPKSEPEPPPKVDPGEPVEEPTPPATPTEAPFFEGAEIDDFELIQAAPMAITEVLDPLGSGETVLKMTVDEEDVAPVTPTDNPRAQALSPDVIENGDEFWLKTKFLLPQNFPEVDGWMSLVSIYGPPFNSSSPWQIEVIGNHLEWTRNRTYGFDVPWEVPLRKGVWVTLLTHERFATDGWVEMWIDGQPVTFFPGGGYNPSNHAATTKLEMQTMDSSNNGGGNSAKIMQYREAGMFDTGTVYFGALTLGETRESVEG
jgi:Polysaccharide lyase